MKLLVGRPAGPPRTHLGWVIRRLRVEAGLTVFDAAERAGLSRWLWYDLEIGRREPHVTEFVAIARALGVDPGDLIREAAPHLADVM